MASVMRLEGCLAVSGRPLHVAAPSVWPPSSVSDTGLSKDARGPPGLPGQEQEQKVPVGLGWELRNITSTMFY